MPSQIRSAMLHSFIHGLIKVFVWPMCCVLIFPFFTQEVDRYLRHHDFLNLRKKEILYKKWLEDVSEPLLWKIEDKMDSQSREEIQKRREEQLSLYLNYCKKKVSRCRFCHGRGCGQDWGLGCYLPLVDQPGVPLCLISNLFFLRTSNCGLHHSSQLFKFIIR